LSHYGDRRHHRDARLADREDVRGRPDHFQELDQVIGIFVDAEAACGERDVACVVPVVDKNIVLREHSTHGCA